MNDAVSPAALTETSTLTARDVVQFVKLRLRTILGVAAATVAIACFMTLYILSPTYSAATSIILDPSQIRPSVETTPVSDFEKVVDFQSQIDIAQSSTLAAEVVDELNLGKTRALSRIETMMLGVKDVQRWLGGILHIKKWQKPRDPRAEAIAAVMKGLNVQMKPQSVVLNLVYKARNPDEAADTVNALVRHYRQYFLGRLHERATGVAKYLETQREDVGRQLADAERKITTLREQDRVPLDVKPQSPELVGVVDSQKTQDELKSYVLLMEEDLRKLEAQYSPDYPLVVELKQKIQRYIDVINTIPQKDLELQQLQRKREIAQDGFKYIDQNLERARLTGESNAAAIGMVKVLDSAVAPSDQESPKPKVIIPLSVVIGLVLGVLAAAVVHYFDQRIHAAHDVQHRLGLRVLGSIN